MLVYHTMQVLLETAITSVKNTQFEKENISFGEVLQKALFKTLVSSKNSINQKSCFLIGHFLSKNGYK